MLVPGTFFREGPDWYNMPAGLLPMSVYLSIYPPQRKRKRRYQHTPLTQTISKEGREGNARPVA